MGTSCGHFSWQVGPRSQHWECWRPWGGGPWGSGCQWAACPCGEGGEEAVRSGTAPQNCHTVLLPRGSRSGGCLRNKSQPKDRFLGARGNPAGNRQDTEAAGSGRCGHSPSSGKNPHRVQAPRECPSRSASCPRSGVPRGRACLGADRKSVV